jgi:hypothetical protein
LRQLKLAFLPCGIIGYCRSKTASKWSALPCSGAIRKADMMARYGGSQQMTGLTVVLTCDLGPRRRVIDAGSSAGKARLKLGAIFPEIMQQARRFAPSSCTEFLGARTGPASDREKVVAKVLSKQAVPGTL